MVVMFLVGICLAFNLANASEKMSTGFYYPLKTNSYSFGDGYWLGPGRGGSGYHLGVDMWKDSTNNGESVYAISSGKIKSYSYNGWGVGNVGIFVEHFLSDGRTFLALYGHIKESTAKDKNENVYPGEYIGTTGSSTGPVHIHFGIVEPGKEPIASYGYTESKNNLKNFIDPIAFMENNYPYNGAFDFPEDENKFLACMETDLCEKKDLEDIVTHKVVRAIIASAYSDELKKRMLDYIQLQFGKDFISDALTPALLDEITYSGPGYQSPIDPVELDLELIETFPDFIIHELILTDTADNEKYEYTYNQDMQMHAYAGNIGLEDWYGNADDIYVRFYLSRGYKARNSDGDWVRVGTQQIKKGNLDVGDSNHEMSALHLQDWYDNGYMKVDGVYNIVACVDRLKDTDNGDGEVEEEHKSNNCSTEAVFEIRMPNLPVQGNLDIINCDSIQGWVKDPNTDNPSAVHVYQKKNNTNDFVFVNAFVADLFRTDVGNHGFRWKVPDSLKDGIGRRLYFFGIDQPKGKNRVFGQTQMMCAAPRGNLMPVYRMYNPTIRSHFYTISEREKNKLIQSGWRFEGVAFYAYPVAERGSTPVYRFHKPGSGHFWTATAAEKQSLMSRPGWRYEGIAFHVHFFKRQGTKPVYRLYAPAKGNHLYTTSWREVQKATGLGYKYEAICFYVY